jgi:hypothetical protein
VIKSLVLPIITHLLTSLPDPSAAIIKEIDNLFFKFIWNNRRDKIKRDTTMRNYEDGGFKMINVTKYMYAKRLRISWMKRLLTQAIVTGQHLQSKILYKIYVAWEPHENNKPFKAPSGNVF